MTIKRILLMFMSLMLILAACGNPAGEPAASDGDTVGSGEQPTARPQEPVGEATEQLIINEAVVTDVAINILESFPVQVQVRVSGELGDGCTELGAIDTNREGDTFFVTIHTERPADAICTLQLKYFEETIDLDVQGLEAGAYTVDVNGVTETFTLAVDNTLPGEDPLATPADNVDLPAEDMAQLITLTLERALIDQEIPDYTLLVDDRESIILSTENIDPELVPELEGIALDLVLLTPEEIQAKANEEGDFPYLAFQEITAESDTKAQVSLGSTWARAEDSDMIYLSGGGFTVEYTKTADGWQGEVISAWIS